jgi:predicted porin
VTITGIADAGYQSGKEFGQNATMVQQNGSRTSALKFVGVEDLGGGMKGLARFEIDPRGFLVDGSALAAHQRYVGVQGGFGAVKLGAVDSAALAAHGAASPLGTATGSGYGTLQTKVFADTRYNRSAKYESPVFNGLSGSVLYAPGMDRQDSTATTAFTGLPFQRQTTELGLAYANGPLNVNFANIRAAATDVAATVAPTGAAASASTSTNMLGANYTMGSATVYAGWNKGKTSGSTVSDTGLYLIPVQASGVDTNGSRLGFKYVMGATSFILSSAQQTIKNTTEEKRKVNGFRVTQDLSKQSSVYVAYETFDTGRTYDNTAGTGGKYNVTAIGIRRQF